MSELLLIALLVLVGWYWLDAIAKREIAVRTGRELAQRFNLQLLDDTVSCDSIWLARDQHGHAKIARMYHFEASADGHTRLRCELQLVGKQLQTWHIPPYLQQH